MEKKEKELNDMAITMATLSSQSTLNMSSTATLTDKQAEAEYDPYAHRESENQYSNMGALAHLLKGSLGSGILAMPMAFKNGGLLFGTIGTIVIGFVCTHCVHILVQSAQTLCVRMRIPALGMPETAGAAFESGPARLRPFAPIAKNFVTMALFCTYYFGLTAYVVFIANSIQQVVEHHYGRPEDLEEIHYTRVFIALLIILLIPLGLIRDLKRMVPFSMVANLCIVVGFAITIYFLVRDIANPSDRRMGTSLKGLPIFFATVLFAMEGIGTVMPVENTMRNPKKLGGMFGILSIAMTVVVILFAAMGLLGYLAYGDDVKGSITLNLPTGEIPAQIVKILLAVTILFTYPLQFYVPCDLLWTAINHKVRTSLHNVAIIAMRVLLVCGTIVVALAVPNLGPIISLVGALFFSILGLFIPAVVETVTRWDGELGPFSWILWKNALLVLLSIFSVVAGSYVSILDIIEEYTKVEVEAG